MIPPARSPEQIAELFHNTYERLAPEFGYVTRAETAKPWDDLPATNKQLMIAVCTEVLAALRRPSPEAAPAFVWQKAEGHPPLPVGDCRKLVWLRDKDGMDWFGVRAYNHAEGYWMTNGQREESADVIYWADVSNPTLPAPPSAPPSGKS